MDDNKRQRPVNIAIAILLSLTPWPALMVIDRATQPCGDGLCSFFPAVLTLGGLCIATIIFLVRSIVKNEQPSLLQFLPPVLWLMLAKPLFI